MIVEKPVTIIEKIVETVVVEKMVEGKVVVVLQTVIVEKPVTITEKVVETVVVEKVVQVVSTTMPAAEMAPPAATAAPQPTAMPAATGVDRTHNHTDGAAADGDARAARNHDGGGVQSTCPSRARPRSRTTSVNL